LNRPSGVAVDSSGNVYVCDRGNHCIRKISPAGEVTTFAGRLGAAGGADGSASLARFRQPRGIAVDANDIIYVADSDSHTIRKILTDGTVSTLAGLSQTTGSSDGLGSLARFNFPVSLCVAPGGELFVTDTFNHTIRKVAVTGEVTTFTGLAGQAGNVNGSSSVAKFNNPSGVCITQAGDLYVSDRFNRSIRKITSSGDVTTVTGGGGWIDGSLSAARFLEPTGITMNANGEIYISDCSNFAIRKIGLDNMVTTLAGRPTWGLGNGNLQSAVFNYAGAWGAVTVGLSGRLYIADTSNFAIRQIQGLEVATAAGMVGVAGTADGPSASARFGHLTGITSDALGNVYVSQANNHQIRKLSSDNQVSSVAGALNSAGALDATGSAARFRSPIGLAVDSSNRVLIADRDNHAIRRMTPEGVVTTIAGTIGTSGTINGPALSAQFNAPQSVAVDLSGLIYVADTSNHCIRIITLDGNVETFAGLAGTSGYVDGAAGTARFSSPAGVAIDTSGNVYVAEGNARIRKITPNGLTTTIGGSSVLGSLLSKTNRNGVNGCWNSGLWIAKGSRR
jgi:streptogramin lyase